MPKDLSEFPFERVLFDGSYNYPAAQLPWILPPLPEHSVLVKQVPFLALPFLDNRR